MINKKHAHDCGRICWEWLAGKRFAARVVIGARTLDPKCIEAGKE